MVGQTYAKVAMGLMTIRFETPWGAFPFRSLFLTPLALALSHLCNHFLSFVPIAVSSQVPALFSLFWFIESYSTLYFLTHYPECRFLVRRLQESRCERRAFQRREEGDRRLFLDENLAVFDDVPPVFAPARVCHRAAGIAVRGEGGR